MSNNLDREEERVMGYIFSKEKMLQRLEREGRAGEIDKRSRQIMDDLDGLTVEKNSYKALVYGINEGMVVHPVHGTLPVNLNDCIGN